MQNKEIAYDWQRPITSAPSEKIRAAPAAVPSAEVEVYTKKKEMLSKDLLCRQKDSPSMEYLEQSAAESGRVELSERAKLGEQEPVKAMRESRIALSHYAYRLRQLNGSESICHQARQSLFEFCNLNSSSVLVFFCLFFLCLAPDACLPSEKASALTIARRIGRSIAW